MGRCKSLGSLRSFLWYAPQLSGASVLCFYLLPFLRAHCREWLQSGGCNLMPARWQVFFVSFLSSLRAHQLTRWRWLQLLETVTSFVYWHGRQYSISQLFISTCWCEGHHSKHSFLRHQAPESCSQAHPQVLSEHLPLRSWDHVHLLFVLCVAPGTCCLPPG